MILRSYNCAQQVSRVFFNICSNAHKNWNKVVNSGRRILVNIPGTKGVKYGYTRAAGFNGAAYVERGGAELVAVVFGEDRGDTREAMQLLVDQAFADMQTNNFAKTKRLLHPDILHKPVG